MGIQINNTFSIVIYFILSLLLMISLCHTTAAIKTYGLEERMKKETRVLLIVYIGFTVTYISRIGTSSYLSVLFYKKEEIYSSRH